jgi:hypothetical protein
MSFGRHSASESMETGRSNRFEIYRERRTSRCVVLADGSASSANERTVATGELCWINEHIVPPGREEAAVVPRAFGFFAHLHGQIARVQPFSCVGSTCENHKDWI